MEILQASYKIILVVTTSYKVRAWMHLNSFCFKILGIEKIVMRALF